MTNRFWVLCALYSCLFSCLSVTQITGLTTQVEGDDAEAIDRTRRQIEDATFDERDKKMPRRFLGMRGKKIPSGFMAFRGRRAGTLPSNVYSEDSFSMPHITDNDFEQNQDMLDSRSLYDFPARMDKRLRTSNFLGMRGKKSEVDNPNILELINGMHEEKRRPSGFLGMRGKKDEISDGDHVPQLADDEFSKLLKRAPYSFLGMRG